MNEKIIIKETPYRQYLIQEFDRKGLPAGGWTFPLPSLSMAIISINKCRPAHVKYGEKVYFQPFKKAEQHKTRPKAYDATIDIRTNVLNACRSIPAYDDTPLSIKNKIYDLMKIMMIRSQSK